MAEVSSSHDRQLFRLTADTLVARYPVAVATRWVIRVDEHDQQQQEPKNECGALATSARRSRCFYRDPLIVCGGAGSRTPVR